MLLHYFSFCFKFPLIKSLFLPQLPLCIGPSVCGVLQSNGHGVSSVPFCACDGEEGYGECDDGWNPYHNQHRTSHNIVEQYKVRSKCNGVCHFYPQIQMLVT